MPDALRAPLRLLAFVLVLAGLCAFVVPFVVGPTDTARALGESCAHSRHGSSEQCTVFDALALCWVGGGAALLLGFIGVVALRGDGAPRTLDLSRFRS